MINYSLVEVNLEQAIESSIRLADDIAQSFKPSVIVGILKGGFLPALEISDRLGVPCEFLNVHIKYSKSIVRVEPFNAELEVSDVLLVDDMYFTGSTLKMAETELNKFNPLTLKTAVLSYSFRPHYNPPDFFDHFFDYNGIAERYPWSSKSHFYGQYQDYLRSVNPRIEIINSMK